MTTTPQIATPQFLHLEVPGTPDRPSVKVRAMHDAKNGVYTNVSVLVEHPAIAVTPTRIAKMRLGALRTSALRKALEEANHDLAKRPPVKSFFRGSIGRAVSEKVRLDPTPEHLENAALVVRLARLTGDFPVRSVERCFAIRYDDAKRWVVLARKSGLVA